MDDITASIIVTCQTAGAIQSVDKLKYALTQVGRYVVQFGVASVNAFRDQQDAVWKFSKTFSHYMGTAEKAVRKFAEEYDLADVTARKMITDAGQLVKGMGFAELESLNLGEEIARWGVDLASFTGYAGGAEGAVQAIIASLAGENEKLKALGVVLREDSKEFRTLVKQMQEEKGMAEQQARVYAKLAMIKRQAADAQGDYKAEGENFTQNIKIMEQAILQIKTNLGEMIYEFISLNDLAGESGGGLQKFANDWKNKAADINHELRVFALRVVGLFDVIAAVTKPIWEFQVFFAKNIGAVMGWLHDTLYSLFSNMGELYDSFLKDLRANISELYAFSVKMAKAMGQAIKAALTGGDWKETLRNSMGEAFDFDLGFKNTAETVKKMNLPSIEFAKLPDDWYDIPKAYNAALDKYEAGIRASEARRDRQKAALQDKGNKDKDTGKTGTTDTVNEILPLGDMLKDLFKYRTTVQSGVVADSTEGVRLSNRRFFFNSPGDPAMQSANHLKKIEDQNKTIVSAVQSLNSVLSGINASGIKIATASGGGIAGFKKY